MNVVGRVGSFITQGMYSVATPFHPFGGAVDIIVVKQHDGSFRTTPWYVRFGKFQGVLKGAEKLVKIEVNGIEADFHMQLDNSGAAYFVREVDRDKDVDNLEEISGGKVKFDDNEFERRDERVSLGLNHLERAEFDSDRIFYEFQDELSSLEGSEYGSFRYDNLDNLELENSLESQDSNSEVVLVNVDGLMLKAPISSSEINAENLQLSTPQFHLGSGKGTEEYNTVAATWGADYLSGLYASTSSIDSCTENTSSSLTRGDVFKSCVEFSELALEGGRENMGFSVEILEDIEDPDKKSLNVKIEEENQEISRNDVTLTELQVEDANPEKILDTDCDGPDSMHVQCLSDAIGEDTAVKVMQSGVETPFKDECDTAVSNKNMKSDLSTGLEISLCGHLLNIGMGLSAADEAFDSNRISREEFKLSSKLLLKNENLIVRVKGKYLLYNKAAHIILGMAAFDLDLPIDPPDAIPVEHETPKAKEDDIGLTLTPSRRWRLWPIPFRRVKSLEHNHNNISSEDMFVDSESVASSQVEVTTPSSHFSRFPRKQIIRTNIPTTDQIASLNLKEGQNMVNFVFSTRVLGSQKVQAHIYLWKWNTRIVISDVDGTITKSDVLGQFMPLVGKDWTHSGIARLFCAIKENGYQLLFLSARAIVQSYLTKSFLSNLKQDGKSLPNGPVVISPDGLFPSLYREVIRRAPHEFKIACLEDIKALFPPNYNPFYAGFGNRDTDELSYRKMGIPKGKIFIINPKGEVAINHRIDVKSYTSLHTLVHDMFPPTSLVNDMLSPTSLVEQEEYNSWNYWKTPLPDID